MLTFLLSLQLMAKFANGGKKQETVVIKKQKKHKNFDKTESSDRIQRKYEALAKSLQELLIVEKGVNNKKKIAILEQQIITAELNFQTKLGQAKDRELQRDQLIKKVQ